jgi:hypothetical protein
MKKFLILWLMSIALTLTCFRAWASPDAVAISSDHIAAALHEREIRVSPSQVQKLTEVHAAVAKPILEVISVNRWNNSHLKVRLRCRQLQECRPFYILVNWRSRDEMNDAVGRIVEAPPEVKHASPPSHLPWLVHSGEKVTLLLESDHMRIELPVVCLANGSAGKHIRVRSTEQKKIFVAEVVSSRLLKGRL